MNNAIHYFSLNPCMSLYKSVSIALGVNNLALNHQPIGLQGRVSWVCFCLTLPCFEGPIVFHAVMLPCLEHSYLPISPLTATFQKSGY